MRPQTRIRRTGKQPALRSLAPSAERKATVIVQAAGLHCAARLAALDAEIGRLCEATESEPAIGLSLSPFANGHAPAAVIKQRAARYRMPRLRKRQLIDRFCDSDADSDAGPTTMIIAAHQDDESIGAGARLCNLRDVWIVHVTDGAPRDRAVAERYGFTTRDEYAAARSHEVRQALALAGISEDRMICLDYVDGEASLKLVDLVMKIMELLDTIAPDVVVTHPYEGGHTDHDATAFAVHLACGVLRREGIVPPAVLEMTSYYATNGESLRHDFLPHRYADRDRRVILLDDAEQQTKVRMYECFTSQQGLLRTFNTEYEKFRPAPRYIFTRPPHTGQLNYERYGVARLGEHWRKAAGLALHRLGVRPRG